MLKRFVVILTALMAMSITVSAADKEVKTKKQRTYRLWGHVKDSFTKVGIPDVMVTLMTPDSAVVDTFRVKCNWGDTWNKDYWYYFDRPVTPEKFIIKAEHPDYETCFVNYNVKHIGRNTYFDAPWHFMKRKTRHDNLDTTLEEVVVKGTRVKMTYKGDTLVFDAAAFKLPDGSMLDALIKQLPGVELSDDGVITVNGRKVDFLTLNGKDFFKGNNKVMLDNLPYYTVENIKVHEKKTEKSEYMGRNIEEPNYVMDVNLKREYNRNYIANAEAGVATEGKYMGRGFGSRITDHTNVSAYFNLNDINETRRPSGSGDWSPANAPTGKDITRTAGVNVEIDDKDKRYKESLFVEFSHNTHRGTASYMQTQYLTDGTTYNLDDNYTRNSRRSFSAKNSFTLLKPFWMRSTTEIDVGGYRQDSRVRSSRLTGFTNLYGEAVETLDSIFRVDMPQELREMLTNRRIETSHNVQDNFAAYQRVEMNKKLPWGDNIEFEVNGRYQKYDTEYFTDSRLDYFNSQTPADYRNVYSDNPTNNYRWEARGEYYLNFQSGWTWRLYSLFNQTNDRNRNDQYRLERLEGWQNGMHQLGEYPLDPELLQQAWSAYDSEHTRQLTRLNQTGLHFYYDKRTDSTSRFIRFHLPLFVNNYKYAYNRGDVDTCFSRNSTIFEGNINVNIWWDRWRQGFQANFWHNVTEPDMNTFVNMRDDRNPLSVTVGNPNLKNSHQYRWTAYYTYNTKNKRLGTWMNLNATYRTDPLLQSYSFDRRTGVYTYRKENGDYAWNGSLNMGARVALDKKSEWYATVNGVYYMDVNQTFRMENGMEKAQLYDVRSYNKNVSVSLRYDKNTLHTAFSTYYHYRKIDYKTAVPMENVVKNIGVSYNIQYTIPLIELQISSNLDYYHTYSSVEGTPTQNDWFWYIYLSRALTKDKSLLLKLSAFDILNSMSHYNYSSYDNVYSVNKYERLNRYVMLSVAWQFKAKPKK